MGVSVGVGDGDTVGEGVGDAADAGEIVGTDSTVSGLSHARAAVASNSATKVEIATEVQQVLAGFLMAGPLSSAPRLTSLLLSFCPFTVGRLHAAPLHGLRVQLQSQARTVGVGRPYPVLLVGEFGVPDAVSGERDVHVLHDLQVRSA